MLNKLDRLYPGRKNQSKKIVIQSNVKDMDEKVKDFVRSSAVPCLFLSLDRMSRQRGMREQLCEKSKAR